VNTNTSTHHHIITSHEEEKQAKKSQTNKPKAQQKYSNNCRIKKSWKRREA
jgi:hypothetical protein